MEGQLELDAWDGKVNCDSRVVKSVDGLAHSCRGGVEWCGRGSSRALEKRIEVENKNLCEGAWTTFLCMHKF